MTKRIALTGATGFVGGHVVDALMQRGFEVVALARATSNTQTIEKKGAKVRRVSLNPQGEIQFSELRAALADVNAIVHAAGGGITTDKRSLYAANTDSTAALLHFAPPSLDHFVLVSSLAARGPSDSPQPAKESGVDKPASAYGRSKLAAESLALAHPSEGDVVVLRPPALMGPGEYRLNSLYKAAGRGFVPMVHSEGTMSFLDGRDLATAICAALQREPAGRRDRFFVAHPKPITRRHLAEELGRLAGRKIRVVELPPALLPPVFTLAELAGRLRGKASQMSRDKLGDALGRHQSCDPRLAMRHLGWEPKYTVEQGLRDTFYPPA